MSPKLLYIHGFGSCGTGIKSEILRRHFGKDNVLAPDLPASPAEALHFLESVLALHPDAVPVGSSLGGFYATWLAERYRLKAVLINPSTKPFETLTPYTGINRWWCGESDFYWGLQDLDDLRRLSPLPRQGTYLVLLQTGDELLDYRVARTLYRNHQVIVTQGGNHRFENLQNHCSSIEAFLL